MQGLCPYKKEEKRRRKIDKTPWHHSTMPE
jgi:hypothetical protein